jgi:hypothetical protein
VETRQFNEIEKLLRELIKLSQESVLLSVEDVCLTKELVCLTKKVVDLLSLDNPSPETFQSPLSAAVTPVKELSRHGV